MSTPSEVLVRRAAAVLAALLVFVIAFVLIVPGGGEEKATKDVISADSAQLRELAADQDHTPYWAGPQSDVTYEWTRTTDGKVFVRYLTGGAKINDKRADFLTVGTYAAPVGGGVAALKDEAKNPGSKTFKVEGGGFALVNESKPSSVYLAYPKSPDEIEVFDPSPERALKLVTSGQIQPIR